MPLGVRENAVTVAVFCFFLVAIIAAANGMNPFVCCKKAIMGGLAGYIAASIFIRVINAIITHALATKKVQQHQQEHNRETE